MRVVGIDPGLTGGIAAIDEGLPQVWDMPTVKIRKGKNALDCRKIVEWLIRLRPELVTLERQQAMRRKFKKKGEVEEREQGLASTATTMQNFGILVGILDALGVTHGIRYEVVASQRWKKAVGIPSGSEKGAALLVAQRLFPEAELHGPKGGAKLGRVDALLIAEYGRRLG